VKSFAFGEPANYIFVALTKQAARLTVLPYPARRFMSPGRFSLLVATVFASDLWSQVSSFATGFGA
jgi:hypothetical protein